MEKNAQKFRIYFLHFVYHSAFEVVAERQSIRDSTQFSSPKTNGRTSDQRVKYDLGYRLSGSMLYALLIEVKSCKASYIGFDSLMSLFQDSHKCAPVVNSTTLVEKTPCFIGEKRGNGYKLGSLRITRPLLRNRSHPDQLWASLYNNWKKLNQDKLAYVNLMLKLGVNVQSRRQFDEAIAEVCTWLEQSRPE